MAGRVGTGSPRPRRSYGGLSTTFFLCLPCVCLFLSFVSPEQVYNLTKFIRKHPDREAILECAGGALDPAIGLSEEDMEDHFIGYLIEMKKDQ